VERAFDHFAAEKPSKDAHAGEENAQPKIVELNNSGEDHGVRLNLVGTPVPVQDIVDGDDDDRYQGEQVDPNPAASEKVAANFVAHKDRNLAGVEPPRLFFRPLLSLRNQILGVHAGPPSDPMRY